MIAAGDQEEPPIDEAEAIGTLLAERNAVEEELPIAATSLGVAARAEAPSARSTSSARWNGATKADRAAYGLSRSAATERSPFVLRNTAPHTTIFTDGNQVYQGIPKLPAHLWFKRIAFGTWPMPPFSGRREPRIDDQQRDMHGRARSYELRLWFSLSPLVKRCRKEGGCSRGL